MSSLEQFIEPIEIARKPCGDGSCKAYKMDSTDSSKNMRKMVGLGTCHCCDYFLSRGNTIILVEETQLLSNVKDIRNEYDYLNDTDKDNFVNKKIREEMRLKAYGSMLILCRLAAKSCDAKKLFQDKKYCFWLIVSNMDAEDKRAFDNLKDDLVSMLKGTLGKEILDNVAVLPSDILETRLSENNPTP